MSKGDTCMVCLSPQGPSPHFGAISCLACAAFFRRTVSLNISFTCKADNHCKIYYELRMICRACRYEKCVEAGMRRECVQKKRPPKSSKRPKDELDVDDDIVERIAPKREVITPGPTGSGDIIGQTESLFEYAASTSSTNSYDECDSSPQTSSNSFTMQSPKDPKFARPVPNAPSIDRTFDGRVRMKRLTNMTGTQLLQHYYDEERIAMDARRVMYSKIPLVAMVQTTGEIPFERDQLETHTIKRQIQTVKFENFLSFQYAQRLPGFQHLSTDEKAQLYKSCALGFNVLDLGWFTARLMRKGEKIVVFTDGTYSELNYETGWQDEPGLITKQQKIKLFGDFNQRLYKELVRPIFDTDIDFFEYAALKALAAWRVWYLLFTDPLQDLAKEHEKLLLDGLIEHYKEHELDISVRLGNIFLLIGSIFEFYAMVVEHYKQIELFNLVEIDDVTKSLLDFY